MNWGHDSGLSGGGLCGCAGCASGHAAALDGRQALTASQTSGDSIVDALVAGGWSKWGPVGPMGQAATVTYSFMTATPSSGPEVTNFQVLTAALRKAAGTDRSVWRGGGGLGWFGRRTRPGTVARARSDEWPDIGRLVR